MSPLTQWACPENKPTYGEAHEPEYCITQCQDKCASPFLIAALTNSNRRNHHKGLYISATALSGCKRKFYLERTVDYADYMKNSFYGYRGTVMHQVVEDASNMVIGNLSLPELGYLTELRMLVGFCFKHGGFPVSNTVDVQDQTTWNTVRCPECLRTRARIADREWFLLGGTIDGIEPIWKTFDSTAGVLEAVLWDLKTMQEYAISYFIKGDSKNTYHRHVKDAHFCQAQVYKYLLERSRPPQTLYDQGVRAFKLVDANIQAFSMGQFPRTGASYVWTDHYTRPEKSWDIPSIPLKDDTWIENYIRTQARPIYDSLLIGARRPPICEPESGKDSEHSWECRFCPFPKTNFCPNPQIEWAALQEGLNSDQAFDKAREIYENNGRIH